MALSSMVVMRNIWPIAAVPFDLLIGKLGGIGRLIAFQTGDLSHKLRRHIHRDLHFAVRDCTTRSGLSAVVCGGAVTGPDLSAEPRG